MTKGAEKSDDWECCEQCSFCFTVFVCILFFLCGAAMAVYAAVFLWSDLDVAIQGLEIVNTSDIQIGIFVVGLCIALTALLGLITAGCAKCASNPDGKCDNCEKCFTAILSIFYITILMLLVAATVIIASFLSYYASTIGNGIVGECPFPSGSPLRFYNNGTTDDISAIAPDPFQCPFDFAMYTALLGADFAVFNGSWVAAQDASVTCGFHCDSNVREGADVYYCAPDYQGGLYARQTTGRFCTTPVTDETVESTQTVYVGTNLAAEINAFPTVGETSTMPFRPTMYSLLNTFLIPFLVVWWCIFVLALLLVIAAFVMCVRKKNTAKSTNDAKYKPGEGVDGR